MKYYQYFDLPNWQDVASKALEYYLTESYFNDIVDDYAQVNNLKATFKYAKLDDFLSKVPEIITMFDSINVTIQKAMFFELNTIPSEKGIHIDGAIKPSRFVIPILNCERSEIAYYTTSEPLITPEYNGSLTHKFPVPGSCTQVDILQVIKPALIRVNELHGTKLPNDNLLPRITLLVDINEDLTHLLD